MKDFQVTKHVQGLYRGVFLYVGFSLPVFAAGVTGVLEELVVVGNKLDRGVLSEAEAASVGTVLSEQIKHRPLLRPAEVLETIPGLVVTQHSGDGKANQYFLRGFNLDHGTDFANYVEGMPVNLVTHGHGQGYTDLNFLIPELVDRVVYKKGPYYASEGDFSSAGSARTRYANRFDKQTVKTTVGERGYRRGLVTGGFGVDDSQWVYALEVIRNDGPWVVEQDFEKENAVLKYTHGDSTSGFSLAAFYYEADWTSTDQIPERLVDNGTLNRFGSLDDTTGGDTHRYSLSGSIWGEFNSNTRYRANLYVVDYELELVSNPTFFASGPVNDPDLFFRDDPDFRGDQFVQFDDRTYTGGDFTLNHRLHEKHELETGVTFRYDDIRDVGLGNSQFGEIFDLVNRSSVEELSWAGFASVHSQWTDWFATIAGFRFDQFDVDVDSKLDDDVEGDERDNLASSKLSLRFGPFEKTEFFLNYGEGFHSNDARGVVSADSEVPLLSASEGYEIGLRSAFFHRVEFSLVFFQLDLDSELVFVGDEATTEPSDATRRKGVEVGILYRPFDWLVLDMDFAQSDAEFRRTQFDDNGAVLGRDVPDSVERVFSLGASVELENGLFGGIRVRYFGPRNLEESGQVKSDSTELVNANIGYRLPNGLSLGVEVINVFDAEDNDITYFYASRTREERLAGIDPIEDRHSHPVEPRTVRATLAYEF